MLPPPCDTCVPDHEARSCFTLIHLHMTQFYVGINFIEMNREIKCKYNANAWWKVSTDVYKETASVRGRERECLSASKS